ncbi:MAG: hypothetical protein KGL57_02830 [Burkholderiales bacterium]|nr:hypothetical protein [Burkholderiales bacterium]
MAVGGVMLDVKTGRWPRRLAIGGAVVAAVWFGLAYVGRHAREAAVQDGQTKGMSSWMSASVGANAISTPVPTFKTGLESLPKSLAGTEVAGDLREDERGQLIVNKGVRDVFDYFLSSRGEQSDAVLDARIRAYVKHRLGATAAQQALALLDAYLGYLQQLDVLATQARGGATLEISERMVALDRLRARSFTPEVVQAFFGQEQLYDHYTVDKLAVFNDHSLTPVQKAAKLKALRLALPADLQASLDATEVAQSLQTVTQEWRQRGGSVAELRTIRESVVGHEAADRLESLDRENQAWDARIQAHLRARAGILTDATLADSTKEERVQALRVAGFSAAEQARVQTFERMADQKVLAVGP